MSFNEDQYLNENEEPTLEEERESVELSEEDNEAPVTRAEMNGYLEKQANLEKGIKKMATAKGREEANNTPQIESSSDVNTILFQNQRPEVKDVWHEIEKRADEVGEDPIIFYNNDPILQEYAKTKYNKKIKEAESKSKLDAPSSFNGIQGKVNLDKVEAKDVKTLKTSDQQAWVNRQIQKEREL